LEPVFSGSLLALHLLESGPDDLTIFLIERGAGFGRGLAYGTRDPPSPVECAGRQHVPFPIGRVTSSNGWRVGATRRSPTRPLHHRRAYGDYLGSLLRAAVSRPTAPSACC